MKSKAKFYRIATQVLKYSAIVLSALAVVIGFSLMLLNSVTVGLVTMFGLLAFSFASLVSHNICKVYRDGYEAQEKQESAKNVEILNFEKEQNNENVVIDEKVVLNEKTKSKVQDDEKVL